MTIHSKYTMLKNWHPTPWKRQIENCRKIMTLGDVDKPVTCSMDAALAIYPDMEHISSGSFESAYQRTLDRESDAFLVSTAYPKINNFLMDDEIIILDINAREIPPLVLCTKHSTPSDACFVRLFAHPATIPLVPKITFEVGETILCGSNEAAALATIADSEQTAAISNLLAAEAAELQVLQTLRQAAPMGWLLLGRRRLDG